MTEDEKGLGEFLASQQNLIDHLTRQIYGSNTKFEHLSAFGQARIEGYARDYDTVGRQLTGEIDNDLRVAQAEIKKMKEEVSNLLVENEDLWRENEDLRMELLEREEQDESRTARRTRQRQDETGPSAMQGPIGGTSIGRRSPRQPRQGRDPRR